jgi:thioredoxin
MNYLTTDQFKNVIFDIGKENEIKYKGIKPCIVMFSADWCVPCKTTTPILEELEKENKFDLYKVDVDEEYELSKFFNIRSIPTLLFVPLNGKPISHVGSIPRGELKKLITKYFGE